MLVIDKSSPITKRKMHPAGYLIVEDCSVARSGILYYAEDKIITDGDPNKTIAVYRPPSEIRRIADQYANLPLTMRHPQDLEVRPDTARGLMIGHLGSKSVVVDRPDGEVEARADVVVTDDTAITKVQDKSLSELSAGYHAKYENRPGVAPCGTAYDYLQTGLKANHCALVEQGRCGSDCRVNDESEVLVFGKTRQSQKQTKRGNAMKTIIVDGKQFENVPDELAESLKNAELAADAVEKKTGGNEEDADDSYGMKKKKKPVADESDESTVGLFDVVVGDSKMKVDAQGLAYIKQAEEAKRTADSEEIKAADAMETVKVATTATKIVGDSFDVSAHSTPESMKREVVKHVFGEMVADDQMKTADALDSLYSTAVKMHTDKLTKFGDEQKKLTGDGADTPKESPFAQFKTGPAATTVVGDATDKPRRIQFVGDADEKEAK